MAEISIKRDDRQSGQEPVSASPGFDLSSHQLTQQAKDIEGAQKNLLTLLDQYDHTGGALAWLYGNANALNARTLAHEVVAAEQRLERLEDAQHKHVTESAADATKDLHAATEVGNTAGFAAATNSAIHSVAHGTRDLAVNVGAAAATVFGPSAGAAYKFGVGTLCNAAENITGVVTGERTADQAVHDGVQRVGIDAMTGATIFVGGTVAGKVFGALSGQAVTWAEAAVGKAVQVASAEARSVVASGARVFASNQIAGAASTTVSNISEVVQIKANGGSIDAAVAKDVALNYISGSISSATGFVTGGAINTGAISSVKKAVVIGADSLVNAGAAAAQAMLEHGVSGSDVVNIISQGMNPYAQAMSRGGSARQENTELRTPTTATAGGSILSHPQMTVPDSRQTPVPSALQHSPSAPPSVTPTIHVADQVFDRTIDYAKSTGTLDKLKRSAVGLIDAISATTSQRSIDIRHERIQNGIGVAEKTAYFDYVKDAVKNHGVDPTLAKFAMERFGRPIGGTCEVLHRPSDRRPVPAEEMTKWWDEFAERQAPGNPNERVPGPALDGFKYVVNDRGSGIQINDPNDPVTRTYISFASGAAPTSSIGTFLEILKQHNLTDKICFKINDPGSADSVVLYSRAGDPNVKLITDEAVGKLPLNRFGIAPAGIQHEYCAGVSTSPYNLAMQNLLNVPGLEGHSYSEAQENSARMAIARAVIDFRNPEGRADTPLKQREVFDRARDYFGQCLRLHMIDPTTFQSIPKP